jgi:signal transduction histidine kinase
MVDLLSHTLGTEIEIDRALHDGLWPTFADRSQVENALLNLAINARDAMPGGGKLTIETGNVHLDDACAAQHSDVAPGDYVMLAVTDTGTGMTADVLERALEPFFTTKDAGKGSGLGLSMIYGFAKQSRGHVKIYSEVGHGTTVRLYLPRHGKDGPSAAKPIDPQAEEPHGSETILWWRMMPRSWTS